MLPSPPRFRHAVGRPIPAGAILLALLLLPLPRPALAWTSGGYLVTGTYDGHKGITEFDGNGNRVKTFGIFQVQDPGRMALDGEGNLLVADSFAGNVKKFDPQGNLLGTIGDGTMIAAGCVAVGFNGDIYVGDRIRGEVRRFDDSGTLLGTFGGDLLLDVSDMQISRDGQILVADGATGNLSTFSPEGQPAGSFRIDVRSYLSAVTTDEAGDFYLPKMEVIEKRDPAGNLLQEIPLEELHVVSSLRMNGEGNLVLLDYLTGCVEVIDPQGGVWQEFGGESYRYSNDVLILP